MEAIRRDQHRKAWLPVRYLKARPRLFACAALGLAIGVMLPQSWHVSTRLLLAWNTGTCAFLASCFMMMLKADHTRIRQRAALQDEGQFVILAATSLAAIASIVAIVVQLGSVKDLAGWWKLAHVGLAFLTITTAWAFVHVMFALHYAHSYYDEWKSHPDEPVETRGGMDFPGARDCPDYFDFLYFSIVIGVACATADVNLTSPHIRRLAIVHCVLSFFFNLAILGLTINISAGLV